MSNNITDRRLLNNNDLYFINSIEPMQTGESKDIEGKFLVTLSLEAFEDDLNSTYEESFKQYVLTESMLKQDKGDQNNLYFYEGMYVYLIDQKDGASFKNANNDKRAKGAFAVNNRIRGRMKKNYKQAYNIPKNVKCVFSYHINVGHGNCSILVIKSNDNVSIWMVDCSNFDFLERKSYQSNIDKCIDHINNVFGIKKFKIDIFFLTHPHYDHYSGIITLINKNYINTDTNVWINLHYSWAQGKYNKTLAELHKIKCPLFEPTIQNIEQSKRIDSVINLWHPKYTVKRSKTNNYNIDNNEIEVKNINNSSVVYKFTFNDDSILFTGDIDIDGWDNIENCNCSPSYYCISHHGSINGHLRRICPNNKVIETIETCNNNTNFAILMGRDKAYNGIFNDKVLQSFQNRLYRTDKDQNKMTPHFFELNWNQNKITYH